MAKINVKNSVYSVRQVNHYIKSIFSQDYALRQITVKGEVSNYKYHTSGHIYFTIKDDSGVLACVMFAGSRSGLKFRLAEGQTILVTGSINVYERDGSYQLYAQQIELDGDGDLYSRFMKLKQDLEEMGMFASEYKQPIPTFCRRIGVVTAPTGAVIRDIQNVAFRRNPYVELILYPAYVQGDQAVPSIVRGIEVLDGMGLDCIIVGRGGGSIEDLWAFNEEEVARAIFDCETPIISAVGHETDVTIADFVADLRAPTPSAAAELAVFEYDTFVATLQNYKKQLNRLLEQTLNGYRSQLQTMELKLQMNHPVSHLAQERQYLDYLQERLCRAMENTILRYKDQKQQRNRLELLMEKQMRTYQQHLDVLAVRLDALSPLRRLSGGFAYVEHENQKPAERAGEISEGEIISIRFQDGIVRAKALEISGA
ncbi:MAG: exodeoxyribonuclease VII large subunit [Lachnospiraceae bacterium]